MLDLTNFVFVKFARFAFICIITRTFNNCLNLYTYQKISYHSLQNHDRIKNYLFNLCHTFFVL